MDTDLVVRAQRGDRVAFETLAAALYGRLHQAAFRILRDRALAEDAAQQAMLSVWRNLPRLREPERFEAWSYRLLVNACHSEGRRRRDSLPNTMMLAGHEPSGPDDLGSIVDRDELERGFRRLSVDHRAVLVLRHYVGLTAPQVAEVLGVPVGTVNSRLDRALRSMRLALHADPRSAGPEPAASEASL